MTVLFFFPDPIVDTINLKHTKPVTSGHANSPISFEHANYYNNLRSFRYEMEASNQKKSTIIIEIFK